ncbi:hypothetical protein D3C87_2072640 [compost metagenome]
MPGLVNGRMTQLVLRHDVSLLQHLQEQAIGDRAMTSSCETPDVPGKLFNVGTRPRPRCCNDLSEIALDLLTFQVLV